MEISRNLRVENRGFLHIDAAKWSSAAGVVSFGPNPMVANKLLLVLSGQQFSVL